MRHLYEEIKRRRLIEWMVAYVAAAILLLELVEVASTRWPLTESAVRGVEVSVGIGFLAAFVVAWYHGPPGRQDPPGQELLILTFLILLATLMLTLVVDEPFVAPGGGEAETTSQRPLHHLHELHQLAVGAPEEGVLRHAQAVGVYRSDA